MELIDTHAHVNFNAFKEDTDEVIRRSLAENVWMINVGSQFSTSERAVAIAESHGSGVYASVGLHPIHLTSGLFKAKVDTEEIEFKTREEEFDFEKYKKLALRFGSGQAKSKVVAIGETGFDYWYKPKTKVRMEEFKNRQKEVFLQHLKLAKESGLPLIFHCRVAFDDFFQAIKDFSGINGVMHCFTGDWEQAEKCLKLGFYIGFNGIIFKFDSKEVIKKVPLERILVETDCPYLTPNPMTGRNEPLYVKYVAEEIAKIKNIDIEEIAKVTTENAKRLFGLA